MTYDEKAAHIEQCLYELKETTSIPERIKAIDDFLAIGSEIHVSLFDIMYQTHDV